MPFTAAAVKQFLDLNTAIEKTIERVAQRLEDLQKQMPELRQSRTEIHLIPCKLAQWIPSQRNWLYYWLSPAYRYRCQFPQKYSALLAQQQALFKAGPQENQYKIELSCDENLKKYRALELKLNATEEELQHELQLERLSFFKSLKKTSLIKSYISFIKNSQLHLLFLKTNALKEYTDQMKTLILFPKLESLNESISILYRQDPFRHQVLNLCKEIKASLKKQGRGPKISSLEHLLHEITFVLAQFYRAHSNDNEYDSGALEELENLLNKGLHAPLEMDFNTLQTLLERSCQAFSQHITHINPLYQRACEKLLYTFMLHYLNFVCKNPFPEFSLRDKLKLIEQYLIQMELKTPVQSSYIQEIIQLKNNPQTKYPEQKIQIQCAIMIEILQTQLAAYQKPKMRIPQAPGLLETQAHRGEESTLQSHPSRGTLR